MESAYDFKIAASDLKRPWGGFHCIASEDTPRFVQTYFPEYLSLLEDGVPLSPKLLLINPRCRLSWQYHDRRKELWKVVEGPVGIVQSLTDLPSAVYVAETGTQIVIEVQERHRLVGLLSAAVVAELWWHLDPTNPSTEEDIIRLQDDYRRV